MSERQSVVDHDIRSVIVLGAGSAGLLSAMTLQRAFPEFSVTIVHAPDVPIIGVGESTTALFPPFLHRSLGFNIPEFFSAVQPSWKLGIRFLWGDPRDTHFNYTFDSCMSHQPPPLRKMPPYYCLVDWKDASRCWALMDRGLSPCYRAGDSEFRVDEAHGYHIENRSFIDYLMSKVRGRGIQLVEGNFRHAVRDEAGDVTAIGLKDGRQLVADLFVDCSGFASQLLGTELAEPYTSYADSLFCDRAMVGRWDRERPILPYTTAETMDHGWCWRIEFPHHVTRGYVFSSQFCTDDDVIRELRAKNPILGDDLRVIKFRSGRYDRFWVGNVIGVGNSAGFVEPLEATALHVMIEQIRLVCRTLTETDRRINSALRELANQRYRVLWDEVRDFLAVHYRFNRWSDSPFWRHCRADTNLAGARELVELYQQAGPATLCATALPGGHIFGYDGFMSLLVGQRVPTAYANALSPDDLRIWNAYRNDIRRQIGQALPMEVALRQFEN
jgi:tryptophan halogenase